LCKASWTCSSDAYWSLIALKRAVELRFTEHRLPEGTKWNTEGAVQCTAVQCMRPGGCGS
jgi:hypothetical protein